MFRRCLSFLAIVTLITFPALAGAESKADPAWNGERSMKDIETQVSFGPRSLDAPGHAKEISYIKQELAKLSVVPEEQSWSYTSPDGKHHSLANLIAHFSPENPRRLILGTHYDSIIMAYRDLDTPMGYMPGANNSASGVAMLLETARALKAGNAPPVGVDMIFFDGEEGPLSLGAGDQNWEALGSPYFAGHFPKIYEHRKPEAGVIFDMVCYKNIKLRPEMYSMRFAETQVQKFWKIGYSTAPSIFSSEMTRHVISDDQVALTQAGIPSFLVIGFEYEPWFNTTKDTIDKCSAEVMAGLGKTVLKYIYSQ